MMNDIYQLKSSKVVKMHKEEEISIYLYLMNLVKTDPYLYSILFVALIVIMWECYC